MERRGTGLNWRSQAPSPADVSVEHLPATQRRAWIGGAAHFSFCLARTSRNETLAIAAALTDHALTVAELLAAIG